MSIGAAGEEVVRKACGDFTTDEEVGFQQDIHPPPVLQSNGSRFPDCTSHEDLNGVATQPQDQPREVVDGLVVGRREGLPSADEAVTDPAVQVSSRLVE